MGVTTNRHRHPPIGLVDGIPPVLRPVLRAYAVGYLSSTAPRVLTLILTQITKKGKDPNENPFYSFLESFLRIIKGGLELQRFPTFCAALVGGSTFLQIPLRGLFTILASSKSSATQLRLTRWMSTFIAAWLSLSLLQTKTSSTFIEYVPEQTAAGVVQRPKRFAGRTMDLTIFAVTRAIDVVVGEVWSRHTSQANLSTKKGIANFLTSTLADPLVFASSCALIMWAWIYSPDRLPRSYNKWIKTAAMVDHRLLLALRRFRYGEMKYGVETGQAELLAPMCRAYNLPEEYGDPVKTIPIPCELVHMGAGKNCEYHALSRFLKGFAWSFSTYLPINLILALRNPNRAALLRAIKSSARSSAFLGSFISLYYYGICLTRSRIGPLVLGTDAVARQKIESGMCIGGGCALCGWSVLLENGGRRKELGLFVVPRALATLLPRRYEMKDQWRENLAFAISTAVVFTCIAEKPERVRGVLGKGLRRVLEQ